MPNLTGPIYLGYLYLHNTRLSGALTDLAELIPLRGLHWHGATQGADIGHRIVLAHEKCLGHVAQPPSRSMLSLFEFLTLECQQCVGRPFGHIEPTFLLFMFPFIMILETIGGARR